MTILSSVKVEFRQRLRIDLLSQSTTKSDTLSYHVNVNIVTFKKTLYYKKETFHV